MSNGLDIFIRLVQQQLNNAEGNGFGYFVIGYEITVLLPEHIRFVLYYGVNTKSRFVPEYIH